MALTIIYYSSALPPPPPPPHPATEERGGGSDILFIHLHSYHPTPTLQRNEAVEVSLLKGRALRINAAHYAKLRVNEGKFD